MTDAQEAERLARARNFDRQALTEIYDTYHPPIYRYIYRQVGDIELARDLTAVVFQRLLQALEWGKGPRKHLQPWLYRTAHNALIDHYRRQQHRNHLPLREEMIAADDNPAHRAESNIAGQQVRESLQQLTPDQQQVLALKFLQGLSNQEIAEVLDKTIGSVKALQHRGLAALQRHFQTEDDKVTV